jgi:hypothetical protein
VKRFGSSFVLGLVIGFVVWQASSAQALPQGAQAQQLLQAATQQNPGLIDLIRSRLQESGLSADQIRARLAASGYPPDMLDAYLGPGQGGESTPAPGADQLTALQALGLGGVSLASDSLHVDTGMIR